MTGGGDYISREAVVNGIWKALYSYEDEMEAKFEADPELDVAQWFFHRIFVQTMSSIDLQVILDAPAADVRPVVHGKWLEHNYDPEYLSCDFSCSECNVYLEEYYFGEGQWPGKTDHCFCPNCGADMREES